MSARRRDNRSALLDPSPIEQETPLKDYYAEASVPLAHGRNIVNVLLVDFRALDTLGEITVLAVAALGVLGLLRLRAAAPGEGRNQ